MSILIYKLFCLAKNKSDNNIHLINYLREFVLDRDYGFFPPNQIIPFLKQVILRDRYRESFSEALYFTLHT